MTVSAWRLREAASHIQSGSVIACPAEAVWGLSCDPWRLSAVAVTRRVCFEELLDSWHDFVPHIVELR